MGVITDYFALQKKYQEQYGERTVVVIEKGSFFELYEYSLDYCMSEKCKVDKTGKIWNESIGHAIKISTILNCNLTYSNSTIPYGIQSPHMIGFPVIAFEKNKATLLANDYVVIRVDQQKDNVKTPKKKGNKVRFVAEICSPTMELDNISLVRSTSNVACLYIEYQQGVGSKYENFHITTGASVVDIITGQNRVCEFYSKVEDQVYAIQELYRFLISHYPRELIIHITDMPEHLSKHTEEDPNPYIKYLERVLELKRFDRLNTYVNNVPIDYKKIPYQIEFLNKIFNKTPSTQASKLKLNIIHKRNDRIIDEMGLERMNYGRIAYILLMQHCYSHNTDIISKLSKPDTQWIDEKKHLILTHNAIMQLNLISPNNSRVQKKKELDSLMSVLDQTQTHLGRRALSSILQNPMLDPKEITIYYDMVDEMSVKVDNETLWSILDKQLKELPDIARLQRKLEIKLITPRELGVLYRAYIKIINIYIGILKVNTPVLHGQLLSKEDIDSFNGFISRFAAIIDFDALELCQINTSVESNIKWMEFVNCPIKPNMYSELYTKNAELMVAETRLQEIVDHLNGYLGNTRGEKIKFKSGKKGQGANKKDPTGVEISTTAAKANTLLNSPINTNLCGQLQALPYTSSDRIISSDIILGLCSQIDKNKIWMRSYLLGIYDSLIEEMTSKYTFFVPVANLISKLDLIHSYSKVSCMYNYHRPEIVTDGDVSYLEAREVRHPIIERIIDRAYVTNDVFLGNGIVCDDDENNGNGNLRVENLRVGRRSNGMCLWGINNSGKTSMAKAIGSIIIMAQSGCFVPSKLRYKPYSKIITRLSKNDNLFKGESTFAVEMAELRTILRQADANTLVIGDEINSGTESNSGTAITASAILSLIEKGSSFILSTHLHELIDLSCINSLSPEKLNICHLEISYDEKENTLIYDRKLKNGSGPSIYGLMVARSLGLPQDFLDQANLILLEILGQNKDFVSTHKSRYNSKVYVDSCNLCGKSRAQTTLHTHHIIEQNQANERKLIGNTHMNVKDNLLPLCQDCHTNLHRNNKELESLDTYNGKIVRVKGTS